MPRQRDVRQQFVRRRTRPRVVFGRHFRSQFARARALPRACALRSYVVPAAEVRRPDPMGCSSMYVPVRLDREIEPIGADRHMRQLAPDVGHFRIVPQNLLQYRRSPAPTCGRRRDRSPRGTARAPRACLSDRAARRRHVGRHVALGARRSRAPAAARAHRPAQPQGAESSTPAVSAIERAAHARSRGAARSAAMLSRSCGSRVQIVQLLARRLDVAVAPSVSAVSSLQPK